jgi:geranylgeranyl transferase type-2 subunit beta
MDRRMRAGSTVLGGSFRRRHTEYLVATQSSTGAFVGPDGAADPYYTRFALHALIVLGLPAEAPSWMSAAAWLKSRQRPMTSVLECLDVWQSLRFLEAVGLMPPEDCRRYAWLDESIDLLAACRTADGAVALVPGGVTSPYYAFLALMCYDLMGRLMPDLDRAVDAVRACATPDGGFAGHPGAAAGQASPTAAALCFLSGAEAMDEATSARGAAFLASLQRPDGGLAAHPNVKDGDLLSTFTGLYALAAVGRAGILKLGPLGRFLRATENPCGGFRPVAVGGTADVEYTFYGVAALSILADMVGSME